MILITVLAMFGTGASFGHTLGERFPLKFRNKGNGFWNGEF